MKIFMFVMLVALLSATVQSKTVDVPVQRATSGLSGLLAKLHAFMTDIQKCNRAPQHLP